MRNPLQEQLLKAGLAKKGKLDQIAREQAKQRQGKAPAAVEPKVDAQRLQAEKAERDRALAAERNAQAQARELQAQIRQIIEAGKLKREGELSYRFNDGTAIRSMLVSEAQRAQLAKGGLVIAQLGEDYHLLPRAAAEKVYQRDPKVIVLDHAKPAQASAEPSSGNAEDDEYYKQFQVPDDLMW